MAAPLQLGMFVMPIHDPEKPMAQCFDEDIDLALKCEELGYTDFWVGEHHTSTYENIVMPEIFLAKVLGMTENMRVGPAPVCLQYHHPMQVANRLAFFDHLSHGRLNLCFGPGAVPTDMEVHGVHPKDMGARVAESVDCIMNIWQSDPPYRFEGQFWDFKIEDHIDDEMGIGALHKPLQQPHPPVYVPSISRASKGLEAAAARGLLINGRRISVERNPVVVKRLHWIGPFHVIFLLANPMKKLSNLPEMAHWENALNIFLN